MNCCQSKLDTTTVDVNELDLLVPRAVTADVDRRSVLKGAAATVAGLAVAAPIGRAKAADSIKLAFCSQLLCVVPYEVTRAHDFFKEEGLNVELVYTRGGSAAMQALIGGAVDYAATSFDVAVQAFAKGAKIERFATTGRLPLFALAVAPSESKQIAGLKDLEGKTVGVSALGNADHTLALYVLKSAGVDVKKVDFAVLGPNLYEGLRRTQIDAGMVQEPALTLLASQGGRVLFNGMDLQDATKFFGGPYEFMGVAVRTEEVEKRREQMQRLARALQKGLMFQRTAQIADLRKSMPAELMVGGDAERFDEIIAHYRESLYPTSVAIDVASCDRVVKSLRESGVLGKDIDLKKLLDTSIVPA